MHWYDDLKKTGGLAWIRLASNEWKDFKKAYVQEQTIEAED